MLLKQIATYVSSLVAEMQRPVSNWDIHVLVDLKVIYPPCTLDSYVLAVKNQTRLSSQTKHYLFTLQCTGLEYLSPPVIKKV